jgi:hypothetical protein
MTILPGAAQASDAAVHSNACLRSHGKWNQGRIFHLSRDQTQFPPHKALRPMRSLTCHGDVMQR